jgi:HD-GYP domain-containing protein (c-di-GMP phosphodiesterase class II)
MVGRVTALLRNGFALAVTIFALISSLVFLAGGRGFPFLALYLLAALGTFVWIRGAAKTALAAAAAVGGYLVATIAAAYPAPLSWYAVGLDAVLIAFSCVVAWMIGDRVRRLKDRVAGTSVALVEARRRAERAESLASRVGPLLGLSDLDGILRWTLEAARAVAGGTYAHVAGLDGTHHCTVAEGDADAYPSWWHPTIQRLVLWSCREGRVLRSEDAVHGIEGFIAVPIGPEGGERWGAIVLGGKEFDAAEERALKLLADAVAPALAGAGDAPAGRDPVTGLPNRSSLYRVLGSRLSADRTLTVLVAGVDGHRSYGRSHGPDAGDELLRRVGRRLEEIHPRVFRSADAEFVVVLSGAGAPKAREAALKLRRLASEAMGVGGASGVSVGFVSVGAGEGDSELVMDAAARALEEARGRADGVAGSMVGDEAGRGAPETVAIVLALAEAAESRGPYVGEHSRAVARLSHLIGARLELSPEQLRALEFGALLHDVGKTGVPEYVLSKSGRLTEEEHEVLRGHPALGARMLAHIPDLVPAVPAVRHHHERFDGRGYPDGLSGEDIPLVARVVSVADAFDAMVRGRPYARGITQEEALEEIKRNSGTQFDPGVVRALMEAMASPDVRQTGSAG